MKKILLLLSVFVLFSCEQEDLNSLVVGSKTEVGRKLQLEVGRLVLLRILIL